MKLDLTSVPTESDGKYAQFNAEAVLNKVQEFIDKGGTYYIRNVCNELSIFDWWPETLPQSRLKQMKSFLKEAIKLGFTGYVCFKVGATGCANGMWAHKDESTDGYSPDGDYLYHSFTPAYTYWSYQIDKHSPEEKGSYDHIKTNKQLEKELATV